MVQLQVVRKTKTIPLQSVEGAVAEVYTAMTGADIEKVQDLDLQNNPSRLFQPLELIIASWNFENEDKTPVPITAENIKLLLQEDIEALYKGAGLDVKKAEQSNAGFLEQASKK